MYLPLAFLNLGMSEIMLIGAIIAALVWFNMPAKEKEASKPASKKGPKSWRSQVNYLEELADAKDVNTPELQKLFADLRQMLTAKLGS